MNQEIPASNPGTIALPKHISSEQVIKFLEERKAKKEMEERLKIECKHEREEKKKRKEEEMKEKAELRERQKEERRRKKELEEQRKAECKRKREIEKEEKQIGNQGRKMNNSLQMKRNVYAQNARKCTVMRMKTKHGLSVKCVANGIISTVRECMRMTSLFANYAPHKLPINLHLSL